ncbi:MAG: 50S ribosomal protein L24 [Clostridiales bacterium]
MANKVHVKKGDNVMIINGKDKGKKGKILKVYPDNSTVLVEGINMATKHKKPRSQQQQGGIIRQELPVSSSKVKIVCNSCGKPTRTRKEVLANKEKARVCVKCEAQISIVENKAK